MDSRDIALPPGIEKLPQELQDKIKHCIANSPLPEWPEHSRGMPNIFLRSSLFAIIQRGHREAVKGDKIETVNGFDICYTGWRLDQGDLDVLAHAYHLVSKNNKCSGGEYIQITAKGFLRDLGRSAGKSGREWLKDALRRLSASAVEIRFEITDQCRNETYTYVGSLIDEFCHNEQSHTYCLKCNSRLVKVFEAGWTQLQWQQRLSLRTSLAKWLHGFYSSHREPYSLKVVTIKRLCGSRCRRLSDYRGKLRVALDELVIVGALLSWIIDDTDKVHVEKSSFFSAQDRGHSSRKEGA
ncbi:plasmid replication initiator TrfA [Desulfogranum marinum]|uniref:plasmid replication initiator TrfA n=1 Tax=Desulfogranum marinum TaxID=453220 RepID=UPI0019636A25|nr:plasmid replication initiator TrfA [Desulfogranum marinum]MBM9514056.1 hypothetical protein [Desulfogranum marinum]